MKEQNSARALKLCLQEGSSSRQKWQRPAGGVGGARSLFLTSSVPAASTALQDMGRRLEESHLSDSARKEPRAVKACSKARVSAPLCQGKSTGKLTVNSGENLWSSGGSGCKVT